LVWVKHSSCMIDSALHVRLRIDPGIMGFQDFESDITISILNTMTKAEMKTSYVSLETNLYFFLDTLNPKKMLSIIDQFAGQNFYDYATLKLINSEDCYKEFGGCGGCNDGCLAASGKPYLVYDDDGFHK
jgi:hypothetical protein